MPIRTNDNIVFLEDHCPIEEAEALHEILKEIDAPVFDLTGASYLHTAIVQLVMASPGTVRVTQPDKVLVACLGDRLAE